MNNKTQLLKEKKLFIYAISIFSFLCLFINFKFPLNSFAESISKTISYQGLLTGSLGAKISDGNYDMTFKFYEVATNGSAVWTETHSGGNQVSVENGRFNVKLGSITSFSSANIDFTKKYYIETQLGSNPAYSPRVPLTSVPYAISLAPGVSLTVNSLTATTADINGGSINDTSIGSTTPTTGKMTTISMQNGTNPGSVDIYEGSGDGTNKVTITPQTMSSDFTMSLPTTGGSAGQYLATDGSSGILSWSDPNLGDNQPKTAWVTPSGTSGGDYDSISEAISAVNTWCGGAPSASNRCLILLSPGTHTITDGIIIPSYVSLAGSGERASIIKANNLTATNHIIAGDYSEIRDLTYNITGGNENGKTALNASSEGVVIRRATIALTLSSSGHTAVRLNGENSITLDDVTINVTSPDSSAFNSQVTGTPNMLFNNVTITHSGANSGSENACILLTKMDGNTAHITLNNCIINYTGSSAYGIIVTNTSAGNNNNLYLTINKTSITGGSGTSDGIYVKEHMEYITINDSTITTDGNGIQICSTLFLKNSSITATTGHPIVVLDNSTDIKIHHSTIIATNGTYGIENGASAENAVKVFHTYLNKAANSGTNTINCVGAYNDDFTAWNSDCQ